MGGIPVLFTHGFDMCNGFRLILDGPNPANEAGTLFDKFCLAVAGGHEITAHSAISSAYSRTLPKSSGLMMVSTSMVLSP